jgi:orotidine-5'-phosphate decarboxylase
VADPTAHERGAGPTAHERGDGPAAHERGDDAGGRSRLIFAADYPSLDAARAPVSALSSEVDLIKIGLELFSRHGPEALALCDEGAGAGIFLDLKLHDIPATVGSAVQSLRALGRANLAYVTVHASGGRSMLAAAVEAAAGQLGIVAVTVLTSLDAADLAAIGVDAAPAEQVARLARLAYGAGVRAFVCSPAEAALLRDDLGDVTIITPGVRPRGSAGADQKRVTTPEDAIAAGADMLVVGRPIRDAADPVAAARAIRREIDAAVLAQAARG